MRHSSFTRYLLVLVMLGFGVDSHAGTDFQGTDFQGTDFQGTDFQGTDFQGTDFQGIDVQGTQAPDAWLQGQQLKGILSNPPSAQPARESVVIQALQFRGDHIHALLWRDRAGGRASVLRPRDLVGLQWTEQRCNTPQQCAHRSYRIVSAHKDASSNTMPEHGKNGDVWLFHVEYAIPTETPAQRWQNVCRPDRHGVALGLFMDGRWERDGAWSPAGYTFACTSGVLAKCVRNWGYKPWKRLTTRAGQRVSLQPLHQACTRAARADYCGNGISQTRDGTLIDMFDRHDFNIAAAHHELRMEAGFTTRDAAWVARPRWPAGNIEEQGTWLDLGTCRRPRAALPDAAHIDKRVLIYVRSLAQDRVPRQSHDSSTSAL